MSNSVYVAIGTAPEGSVVTEWDKDYDDQGYRFEYSYDLIPSEKVTVLFQDRHENVLNGEEDFGTVLEYARNLIEKAAADITPGDGEMITVQATVSVKGGWSFVATAWEPLADSLDTLA